MSAIAKPIRPGRKAKQRALEAARMSGCICRKPDVELVHWLSDKVQHVQVRHDDACPAVGVGVQCLLVFDAPSEQQR